VAILTPEELAKKWTFPWMSLDVLIGGKSSIDLPELRIKDWDEATQFILSYGYNPENDNDRRSMDAILIEAINFIHRHLLTEKGYKPPEEILKCDDIRHLLMFAANREKSKCLRRSWACAILRVMHTIAHIEGVHRLIEIQEAGKQIKERFVSHIAKDGGGNEWLGEVGKGVELEKIEWKMAKTRESIILKLLHKSGNVAETIFDLIGVRLVTKCLSDVLAVIKYLRMFHIVSVPNVHPSRSRNTIVDVARFRSNVEMLNDMLVSGRLPAEEYPKLLEKLTAGGDINGQSSNPHTASNYRAVQMTCRQLIRYKNPDWLWIDKMEAAQANADKKEAEHLRRLVKFVKTWPGVCDSREMSAFFPYEIQVMDKDAYDANEHGEASHDRYKQSQIRTARRRVLGDILKL
jgi:uncharacterized protein (TIGR04562 family)